MKFLLYSLHLQLCANQHCPLSLSHFSIVQSAQHTIQVVCMWIKSSILLTGFGINPRLNVSQHITLSIDKKKLSKVLFYCRNNKWYHSKSQDANLLWVILGLKFKIPCHTNITNLSWWNPKGWNVPQESFLTMSFFSNIVNIHISLLTICWNSEQIFFKVEKPQTDIKCNQYIYNW